MKYYISALSLLVGYLVYAHINLVGYTVSLGVYDDWQNANTEFARDAARFDACQITKFLNKKSGYKAWTNCSFPDFGTDLQQIEDAYHTMTDAMSTAELYQRDQFKNGLKRLLKLKIEYPKIPGKLGRTYMLCKFKNKDIKIFARNTHAYHTEDGYLFVPEALEVTECKDL